MLLKKISPFLALVFFAEVALAQISKGDAYYEKAEYLKAIPYYKKASRNKDTDREDALIKLGDSYRKVNDWKNAEITYRQAIDVDGQVKPEVYYNYAQALKVNNKYEEAAQQYKNYIKLAPNDEHAKSALKFCTEISYYLTKPREFTVKNVENVNTPLAEFSPFVIDHKLMFIAERESFDFVNYPVNDYDGQPFLNMYISNLNGSELKKAKALSKKLNSQYHDGPGCITSDGKTLYFTRVGLKKKGGVSYAKIYQATGGDRNWGDIKPLNINSESYSVAHPSISNDGNTLFFASDMPGGYGGKDIWCSLRDGDNWSQPVNLGPDVNTSGDEMFPTVRKDGVLYFSSNGLPGFGGLDIYTAKKIQSKWILDRNEGLDLNSSGDDFGITFLNDTLGYFSSNRIGGKGDDDIYLYEFSSKSMIISGTVLLTEKAGSYAKNKKVILFDGKGVAVDSTNTNERGFFQFKNLDSEKRYLAVLAETDPSLFGKARYFLAENDSVIHRVSTRMPGNRFSFKNLPVDPNGLPDLYTDDDLVFAGSLMSGDNAAVAVKNAKLKLVNDFGDVVEETTTNEFGAFAFRNIPTDQNYLVAIEETDSELPVGTKITLTNKSGKEVKTFYKPAKGQKFTFKVLQSEKNTLKEMDADDVNLVMGLYGYMYDQNKRPIINAKLRVKNEDGSGMQELTTTDKGKFNFQNLQAEKDYIFEADEKDPALKDVRRIYIADGKGRIYKVIDIEGGKFTFKVLEVDKAALGEFVIDDPWLKVADRKKEQKPEPEPVVKDKPVVKPVVEEESELSLTIVENIYYPYGDWHVSADGERILNKAVDALKDYPKLILEISSHTDSHSSDQFNLNLSRKRAEACVDYMVKRGIAKNRLKAVGYGESRLLNKCTDGVPCTEDEHKVNRRTEFKITKPVKK
jgi:outer membrane protein OmpA-like peptidoglycan-associated protein/tetratricopeptide (TPR) repeat protein